MGKIDTIHQKIFDLVGTVSDLNQGFYEKPKKIDDEKVPAYAVYFDKLENEISSSATNKRTYIFVVELIYDKESIDETQTVTSDLVSSVIDVLEDRDNYSLSGNVHYTLPVKADRIDDYLIAGKHYLAYRLEFQVIHNQVIN